MDERARRIVKAAVDLAERDGFAAVRMRDVASQAGVALGTLYSRFSSKEEILLAALEIESQRLGMALRERMPADLTPLGRVRFFFETATRGLLRKPGLARALLRALASASPEFGGRVATIHAVLNDLITRCVQGAVTPGTEPTDDEVLVAEVLHDVWFAGLVAWSAGLRDKEGVVDQVVATAGILLRCQDSPYAT